MANATTHEASQDIIIDDDGRVLNDPTHAKPLGHGNSTAAWALVFVVLAGCVIAMIGALANLTAVWIIGGVVVLAGPVTGFVLRRMGFGVDGSRSSSAH